MKYYLELTDDEVKNLTSILKIFINKNECNKDMKEFVESAGNIFTKAIRAEESCHDCFCEDCTKDCEIKKLGLI